MSATIKVVIDRLTARGLTETSAGPRRRSTSLGPVSRVPASRWPKGGAETRSRSRRRTLAPLDPKERETLVVLLSKLR